jgi:rRNA-processing protein FCF1
MQYVIKQFKELEEALVDASSVIYMTRTDFFDVLLDTLALSSPACILDELGTGFDGIRSIDCPGKHLTNDERLVACAREHGLPVISEDKKILHALEREGIPFFNALMMLHFLLFKRKIDLEKHGNSLEKLKKIAWYDKKVWAFGEEVFSLVR